MDRKEAIALLGELGANQLVNPNLIIIEELELGNYQIKLKGNYEISKIIAFLKNRFLLKESMDYLIIFN